MGLQRYTTTEPTTLAPLHVFEEDIYKPLVWQRARVAVLSPRSVMCVPMQEARCAARVTE